MAWNLNDQKSGSQSNKEWIQEGNIETFVFKEESILVHPIVEPIDINAIMAEQKITNDEAIEYVNTKLYKEKWIMPTSMWEHVIPSIPGKRYFSTFACQGSERCKGCIENEAAKLRGIEENKLLPFPYRKRFLLPFWIYNYNRFLFVKQTQDFFEDMSAYFDKHGFEIDFEFYKTGKGFSTKYKLMYSGPTKFNKEELNKNKVLLPNEIDLFISDEELDKKVYNNNSNKNKSSNQENIQPIGQSVNQNNSSNSDSVGDFVIPFGTHKDKTIKQIDLEGNTDYLNFMLTNSTGLIQQKVKEYLESK